MAVPGRVSTPLAAPIYPQLTAPSYPAFHPPSARLQGMEYYAERRLKRLGLLDGEGNTTWCVGGVVGW